MAKPRIAQTEEQRPQIKSVEGTVPNVDAKPRIVKTEEQKPKKPSAEK